MIIRKPGGKKVYLIHNKISTKKSIFYFYKHMGAEVQPMTTMRRQESKDAYFCTGLPGLCIVVVRGTGTRSQYTIRFEHGMVGLGFFRSFVRSEISSFQMRNIFRTILELVASILDILLIKSIMGLICDLFLFHESVFLVSVPLLSSDLWNPCSRSNPNWDRLI